VRAAAGQYLPTITTSGGGEWVSSPTNSSWHDISKGWIATVQGSLPIWDSGAIAGQVIQQRALLSEARFTYEDDVRQVELEIQQAYSNLLQNQELIKSQEKRRAVTKPAPGQRGLTQARGSTDVPQRAGANCSQRNQRV
jgi:outer membrane protein TolC